MYAIEADTLYGVWPWERRIKSVEAVPANASTSTLNALPIRGKTRIATTFDLTRVDNSFRWKWLRKKQNKVLFVVGSIEKDAYYTPVWSSIHLNAKYYESVR